MLLPERRSSLPGRSFAAALALSLFALVGTQAFAKTPPAAPDTAAKTAPAATPSAATSTAPERITSIEGITEYRLPNGLRVLLAPDPSKPTTTVNMTYLVGSKHENYGETGMAHLLEHMLFKGTKNIRNALGEFSRRGLSANGSTSADRTNYYASFSANDDTLDWYIGWQADAMVNSLILREDLDSEMTVVRNEMDRGENSPFRILMQKMRAGAYEWHNYGKSTIGARSDVENVDIDQLQAFYRLHYQPDNAVLVVAGAFDEQRTLDVIAKAFASIPKPTRTLPPLYTVEPVQDGERAVTLRRNGGSPLVAAMYHVPAAGDSAYTDFDLATVILGDTPSGRLYHALVGRGLASNVFGFAMAMNDPGVALFGADLDESMDQQAAMKAMLDTLENIKSNPFTEEELKRAKAMWINAWERGYADPQQVGIALSEAIAVGDWRMFFKERDRIRRATLADVQRAAEQYLLPANRTQGLYIPTDKPVRAPAPKAVDFETLFQGYKGDESVAAVGAFDSTPAAIDAATKRMTVELPNGNLDMALLSKPTRGNRVQAQLLLRNGDESNLKGTRSVSSAVGGMLLRGTPEQTRQQLQDAFVGMNADVTIDTGPGFLTVSMSTTAENLPKVVSTVLDVIRKADFPEVQLAEYRREMTTAIAQSRHEPQALASRAVARHNNPWAKDDPRYVPTFDEIVAEVNQLDRKQLIDYRDTFIGANTVKFSAVGQFDEKAVSDALQTSLTAWPAGKAFTRLSIPYREVKPERFDIITPDKANAFYLSRQWFALQDTAEDYSALQLANFMLGASEKSRLWLRVREKEGLSYSVRSSLSVSSYEPSAMWTIYAIYAPTDRERLEKAISEELNRVVKDGFTDDEVKDAKQALLNYRALSRAQDGALAAGWQDYLQTGRSFAWSAKMDREIEALTTEKVNAALRKHLNVADFTEALAGDFKSAK